MMTIRFDFGLDVQMLRCDGWDLVAGNGGGRVGLDSCPQGWLWLVRLCYKVEEPSPLG